MLLMLVFISYRFESADEIQMLKQASVEEEVVRWYNYFVKSVEVNEIFREGPRVKQDR